MRTTAFNFAMTEFESLYFSNKSSDFWIIVRAIKEFTENEGLGQLPVF